MVCTADVGLVGTEEVVCVVSTVFAGDVRTLVVVTLSRGMLGLGVAVETEGTVLSDTASVGDGTSLVVCLGCIEEKLGEICEVAGVGDCASLVGSGCIEGRWEAICEMASVGDG